MINQNDPQFEAIVQRWESVAEAYSGLDTIMQQAGVTGTITREMARQVKAHIVMINERSGEFSKAVRAGNQVIFALKAGETA